MNRIDLKERIAVNDAFSNEERLFLLSAVNAMPEEFEIEMRRPRNYMGRIEQLWAFLSVDEGGEGICAAPLTGIGTVPLIAADKQRLEAVRPFARATAKTFNRVVRLARFGQREDVETIRP